MPLGVVTRDSRRQPPAHPVAPGFRPLAVTAIDQRVRGRPLADDAEPRWSAVERGSARPVRGRASSDRRPAAPPLFRSYSLSGPPSTDRYRISVKIEPNGAAGTYLRDACPGRRRARRQRAARKLHPAVRRAAGGAAQRGHRRDACAGDAVRAGGGPLRHDRSSGCTGLAIGSIIPSPPKSGASCSRFRTAAVMCVTAGRARTTRWPRDFDATGHLSRSVFDEVGVPREADVYVCGPTRFMAEMKEALAAVGVAAGADSRRALQRQRVDDSRCRQRGDRALHICPRTTPIPVRWCRSRAAASPHIGTPSSYQSLLELAEACDVPVRWSCRTGVCHNCESGLVSGAVVYEPEPLDKPADGNLLVCCSQPIARRRHRFVRPDGHARLPQADSSTLSCPRI